MDPEIILAAIRECVTVIGPGQVLVVRVDPGTEWEPAAIQLAQASAELQVPVMFVVAPEVAVAEQSGPWHIGEFTDD